MTPASGNGTYVYAVVAAPRRPRMRAGLKGIAAAGPVRLVDLPAAGRRSNGRLGRWLVVADVPLVKFAAEKINAKLGDLDWVSRVAVAHEAVVESFGAAPAVLPMKLFTIFTNDARAAQDLATRAREIDRAIERVTAHEEWGVRVALETSSDGRRDEPPRPAGKQAGGGASYLLRKRQQRDAVLELATHAREVVQTLYDGLARRSRIARRRTASESQSVGSNLLLDAVFLVPRARAATFKRVVSREAQRLNRLGYLVSLTGPWPPYSFVSE